MFRGREVTHPERGVMILDRLAEDLEELCVVEQRPIQDGRNMTMMLGPSKAVLGRHARRRPRPRPRPRRPSPSRAEPPRRRRPPRRRQPRRRPRRRRGRRPTRPSRRGGGRARARAGRRRGRAGGRGRRAADDAPSSARPRRPPRQSTGLPYCRVRHAEEEDTFRRQEALQGDRERQGQGPPCLPSHILEKKSPSASATSASP